MKKKNWQFEDFFDYEDLEKILQKNGNVKLLLGFAVGALLGVAAGLLLSPTSDEEDTSHADAQDPAAKESTNQSTVPTGASRKTVRPRVDTGNDDTPTGRTISNIDDLPDRG